MSVCLSVPLCLSLGASFCVVLYEYLSEYLSVSVTWRMVSKQALCRRCLEKTCYTELKIDRRSRFLTGDLEMSGARLGTEAARAEEEEEKEKE